MELDRYQTGCDAAARRHQIAKEIKESRIRFRSAHPRRDTDSLNPPSVFLFGGIPWTLVQFAEKITPNPSK